jgi:sugar phosphate isomerase/epimerase
MEERIAAAVNAGYQSLSLSGLDVDAVGRDGRSAADLGRQARDAGLDLIMDPVMGWYDGEHWPGSRFAGHTADQLLDMCEQLQVRSLSAIGAWTSEASLDHQVERFAAVCRRAAEFGALVHLEFIPFTAIPDLESAWAIVEAADQPNGGLLLDTWHFYRGRPDLDLLARIPGERILAVQVDDAAAEVVGTLLEDTVRRLLPGEGDLDLPAVLEVLAHIDGLRAVGPEVISPVLGAMDPTEAARLAGDAVKEMVAAAQATVG